MAKQQNTIANLKNKLQLVTEDRDTLVSQNMQLALDNTKAMKTMKHKRSFWRASTFAAILGAFGVHYNWKESWIEVK